MKNEDFECENCGKLIEKHPEGSARNHCNFCLYSKHLDESFPGDRKSKCGGIMKPVGIDFKKNKGNMVKHKCTKCQKEILNKVANDDDFIEFVNKINRSL